jgi:hypothetical protein
LGLGPLWWNADGRKFRSDQHDDALERDSHLQSRGSQPFSERCFVDHDTSQDVDHAAVEAVLTGDRAYDTLQTAEQTAVRTEWDRRINERRDDLNLAEEFRAAGLTGWISVDEHGRTVVNS